MKTVLVGSQAAKEYFPDYRAAHDWDYLVDGNIPHQRTEDKVIEYYDINRNEGLKDIYESCDKVATPEQLYTLKVSHSFWNIKWSKTIDDICFFQAHGVQFDAGLFEKLYKGWETIHAKKRANLMKKNEEFFKDSVGRKYVHDDIHKVMAYYDEPMYFRLKDDKESAYIPKKNFLKLSHEDQCKLCREEIYVTALERFAIPQNFKCSQIGCYRRACAKLITTMSKGWFPLFIVLNWSELRWPDRTNYFQLFQSRIGEVREHQQ